MHICIFFDTCTCSIPSELHQVSCLLLLIVLSSFLYSAAIFCVGRSVFVTNATQEKKKERKKKKLHVQQINWLGVVLLFPVSDSSCYFTRCAVEYWATVCSGTAATTFCPEASYRLTLKKRSSPRQLTSIPKPVTSFLGGGGFPILKCGPCPTSSGDAWHPHCLLKQCTQLSSQFNGSFHSN